MQHEVRLSELISPPFLDKIPPNLVCDQIILTARGTQAYFFDFGHVTFLRGQLPFMVIGQISPPFLDKIPPNLVCDQIMMGFNRP